MWDARRIRAVAAASTCIVTLLTPFFLACQQDRQQDDAASPQRTSTAAVTIRFEMHSPDLDSTTKVFISGNLPQLGNWHPAKIPMQPLGNHRWAFELQCRVNHPVEYKYTLGTWKREAANADGSPKQNFNVQSKTDAKVNDEVAFWTTGEARPIQGQITGTVRYHRELKAEGILARDIVVWLPPGYETGEQRYPVLYMQDGQNTVDPKTSAFGVDWQIDETITRLVSANKIKPLIVVGIYNTAQRNREYLPGETGNAYSHFIRKVLKPLIDSSYRTMPERAHTAVGGSSAGGICAFRLAWENPDVFSKAICMSPAFKYQRPDGTMTVDYVGPFKQSPRPNPSPFFYLDNGGIGLEQILQPGIDEMLEAMKAKGMVAEKDFVWKSFPEARHNESAWAERMPAVLELLFGNK